MRMCGWRASGRAGGAGVYAHAQERSDGGGSGGPFPAERINQRQSVRRGLRVLWGRGGWTDESLALGAFLNINVRRAVAVRTRPWLCGTGLAVSASFPSRGGGGRGGSGCIRAEFQWGGGFLGVAVNSTRFDEPPPPPARWGGLCEVQVPHGFGQSVEASRCSDLLA